VWQEEEEEKSAISLSQSKTFRLKVSYMFQWARIRFQDKRGVDELVPGVRHAGEAPVAAVLLPLGDHTQRLAVHRRVPVTAEVGQLRHVQQPHREAHLADGLLHDPHLDRVAVDDGALERRLRLAVARAAGVPVASPLRQHKVLSDMKK
jgi:hypothetical protein